MLNAAVGAKWHGVEGVVNTIRLIENIKHLCMDQPVLTNFVIPTFYHLSWQIVNLLFVLVFLIS